MSELLNQRVSGFKLIQIIDNDEVTEYWYAKDDDGNKAVVRVLNKEVSKSPEAVKDYEQEIRNVQSVRNSANSILLISGTVNLRPCAVFKLDNYKIFENSGKNCNTETDCLESEISLLKNIDYKSEFEIKENFSWKSTIRDILKNRKIVLSFIAVNVFWIFVTVIISVNSIKNKSGNEYMDVINEDLIFSVAVLDEKLNSVYSSIECKSVDMPGKYFSLRNKTQNIEKESNELIKLIEDLKSEIISECGGRDYKFSQSMKNKNDWDSAEKVLSSAEKAKNLSRQLYSYKKLLLKTISDSSSASYKNVSWNLNFVNNLIDYGELNDIELLYNDMPSIGTLNLLMQLQIKIRMSEIETLQYIINYFESLDIRVTYLEAFVNSPVSILNTGDTYISQIGIMARDTSMRPTVYISETKPFYDSLVIQGAIIYKLSQENRFYDTIEPDVSERYYFRTKCTNPGKHYYGGLIHYVTNRGDIWLPFEGEYTVK